MIKKFLKILSKIIAWILLIGGFIAGAWVGIYVMCYGGIINIINGIEPLNAVLIAKGLCKIIFFEISGLIPFVTTMLSVIFFELGDY